MFILFFIFCTWNGESYGTTTTRYHVLPSVTCRLPRTTVVILSLLPECRSNLTANVRIPHNCSLFLFSCFTLHIFSVHEENPRRFTVKMIACNGHCLVIWDLLRTGRGVQRRKKQLIRRWRAWVDCRIRLKRGRRFVPVFVSFNCIALLERQSYFSILISPDFCYDVGGRWGARARRGSSGTGTGTRSNFFRGQRYVFRTFSSFQRYREKGLTYFAL